MCVSVYAHAVGLQPLGYNNIHRSSLCEIVVYDLATGDSLLYTGQNRTDSPNFLNTFKQRLRARTTAKKSTVCTQLYLYLSIQQDRHICFLQKECNLSVFKKHTYTHVTFLARCLKSSVLLIRPSLQSGLRYGLRQCTINCDI